MNSVRNQGWGMDGLAGHGMDIGFYINSGQKSLESFVLGNDIT